jgi:WD40 repeat protein
MAVIVGRSGHGAGMPSYATFFDIYTGETICQIYLGYFDVLFLKFSPDGKWLVTGTRTGTTTLWNVEDGSKSRVFPEDGVRGRYDIVDACFDSSSSLLYLVRKNNDIIAINVSDGEIVWSMPYFAGSKDLTITSDATTLFCFPGQGMISVIFVFDVKTGKMLNNLSDFTQGTFQISADGKWFLNGGKKVAVYSVEKLRNPPPPKNSKMREWKLNDGTTVEGLAVSLFDDLRLQKRDGTSVFIPIDQLSEKDQIYCFETLFPR